MKTICKDNSRKKAIAQMKEMARASLLRSYENGYEAHLIDKHPHGSIYRTYNNQSGLYAFPEESIMLLNRYWSVVMFLETTEDLDRIEAQMNLKRRVEQPKEEENTNQ